LRLSQARFASTLLLQFFVSTRSKLAGINLSYQFFSRHKRRGGDGNGVEWERSIERIPKRFVLQKLQCCGIH
jgi:hypothetical protein